MEERTDLPAHDAHLWKGWLDSVVLAWGDDGLPVVLAGPGAEAIAEGPVHVVTACAPAGVPASAADDAFAQHELFAELERSGRRWVPAVGAVPDGSHHEISAAVWGVDRRVARDLGLRHGQRAVYEIDGEELRVVACDEERVVSTARRPPGRLALTWAQVHRWRGECETILGRGIGRVHCPACGRADPRRTVDGSGPEWTVGRVPGDQGPTLVCRGCGDRWSR